MSSRDSKGRYIKGHTINEGSKRSIETKQKMRKARLGFVPSDKSKEKNRMWHLGRRHKPGYGKRVSEKYHRENGYIRVMDEGYVYFYYPEHPNCDRRGLIRIHRLIIEKSIGRLLNKEEDVHHIDKNKENNNLKNLMLFSNRSAHRRFEFGKSKVYDNEIIFDGRKLCHN